MMVFSVALCSGNLFHVNQWLFQVSEFTQASRVRPGNLQSGQAISFFQKFSERLQIALETCHAIGNLDYWLFPILDLIVDEHSTVDDGDDIANANAERHLGRSLSRIWR
jgi:hypothetical protein